VILFYVWCSCACACLGGRRRCVHVCVEGIILCAVLSPFHACMLVATMVVVRPRAQVCTYGEGEPSDNAVDFNKWATNAAGELAPDLLAGLQFAVFGLGNRQYEHYNAMGKV
jgi:hypothetical protein